MKNYIQNVKGSISPIILLVALVLVGGIWYAVNKKGIVNTDTDAPTITLVSPNGGENLTIGQPTKVTFTTTGEIKDGYKVVIWLEEGAAPLATMDATTTSYTFTVPESVLIGGDAVAPLEPGSYKIRVALYDGTPCTGFCMPSEVKELATDSSDGEVTVKKVFTQQFVPSTQASVKTYTNEKYGFTFNYPIKWKISESANKKSVTVESTETSSIGPNKSIPAYSVKFSAIDPVDFGVQQTKVGEVVYDSTKKTLVDRSETPSRCLPTYLYQGGTVPMISYGGSLMSSPAHFESAILTNKDYIILVGELSEEAGFREESGIISSFKFTNGVQVRLPNCKQTSQPSITVLSPNEVEKLIAASKQVLVALKAKDYQKLQTLTSSDGLSLNEYPDSLDLTKNDVTQSEISKIPTNTTIKLWGYTDGKGDPINLTVGNYIDKWIYNKDYLDAPKIEVNKIMKIAGNTPNEIMTYSGGRNFVAFHFNGFDPKYSGLDWTTMYLIFDLQNGEYKLRAIVKDNWTI